MNEQEELLNRLGRFETDIRRLRRREERARRYRTLAVRGLIAAAIAAVTVAPVVSFALEPVPAGDKVAGDPITADDWNDNFQHVVDGVTALEDRLAVCPPDMTRIGASCIDDVASGPHEFDAALAACHDVGKDLCSLERLVACDRIEPEDSECTTATKGSGGQVWTMTFDLTTAAAAEGGIFDAFVLYNSDNSITVETVGSGLHDSFCCTPQLPPD